MDGIPTTVVARDFGAIYRGLANSLTQTSIWGRPRLKPPGWDNPFTRIPIDIVLEIAHHLDNVSTTSLTLTCWDLYNIPALSSRRQHLNRLETISLLLLLEKEATGASFCGYCAFRRWQGPWNNPLKNIYLLCRYPCRHHMLGKRRASRSDVERHYFNQFDTVIIPCATRYVDQDGVLSITMKIKPHKRRDLDRSLWVKTVMTTTSYIRSDVLEDRLIGALWYVCRRGKHCDEGLELYLTQLREHLRSGLGPPGMEFQGACSHCLTKYTFNIRKRTSGISFLPEPDPDVVVYDIKLELLSTVWTGGLLFDRISPFCQDSRDYISSPDVEGRNFEHRSDWCKDRHAGTTVELWTTIHLKPVERKA